MVRLKSWPKTGKLDKLPCEPVLTARKRKQIQDVSRSKYYWKLVFKELPNTVGKCVQSKLRNLHVNKPPVQISDTGTNCREKTSIDCSGVYSTTEEDKG